jgi:phage terminase small subunit
MTNRPDFGSPGPAMQELNEKQQKFVLALVNGPLGYGRLIAAYEAAGYKSGKRSSLGKEAHRLSRDPRVVEAVAEESKKVTRLGHHEAVAALMNLIRDPSHRDHARAVGMLLDRVDPVMTRHDMRVAHEHRVTLSMDDEAYEQFKALKALGVSPERMRAVLGGNTIPKLERRLAAETKTIEGDSTDVKKPDDIPLHPDRMENPHD